MLHIYLPEKVYLQQIKVDAFLAIYSEPCLFIKSIHDNKYDVFI